jgi:hypothetical protein
VLNVYTTLALNIKLLETSIIVNICDNEFENTDYSFCLTKRLLTQIIILYCSSCNANIVQPNVFFPIILILANKTKLKFFAEQRK